VPLTFVVGTGRCGSTMLSRMLKQHPNVLSLNEFMNVLITPYRDESKNSLAGLQGNASDDVDEKLWTVDIDGKEFWKLLDEPDLTHAGMVNAGIPTPEFVYPSTGRFNTVNGIPRICIQVLPMLSNDPDSLYDKLSEKVPTWPRRSAADHCRALFAMLADMTGRRVVVERSGGTLPLVAVLYQQFPEARFVLLHRDGPDCALSMSRHSSYRLSVMRAMAATQVAGVSEIGSLEELSAAVPAEFKGLLVPPFDEQRFMSYPIPVSVFAYLWSYTTRTGVSALRELPRNKWTSLRYEDMINAPQASMTRLAGFLGISALPQWLDWVCDFITPGRAGSAVTQLDPAELASVRNSCAPGTRALASIELGLSTC
jgi:hypothetical protein